MVNEIDEIDETIINQANTIDDEFKYIQYIPNDTERQQYGIDRAIKSLYLPKEKGRKNKMV